MLAIDNKYLHEGVCEIMRKRKILEVKPRLKDVLARKKIKQKELSRITGISESVLSRFDKQIRHDALTKFIIRDALELESTDDLFEVIYEDTKK